MNKDASVETTEEEMMPSRDAAFETWAGKYNQPEARRKQLELLYQVECLLADLIEGSEDWGTDLETDIMIAMETIKDARHEAATTGKNLPVPSLDDLACGDLMDRRLNVYTIINEEPYPGRKRAMEQEFGRPYKQMKQRVEDISRHL